MAVPARAMCRASTDPPERMIYKKTQAVGRHRSTDFDGPSQLCLKVVEHYFSVGYRFYSPEFGVSSESIPSLESRLLFPILGIARPVILLTIGLSTKVQ